MATRDISLLNAVYSSVPAVQLPINGGGTATFVEISDSTISASDVSSGKIAYNSSGSKVTGTLTFITYYTGSGTPSSSLGNDGDIYLKL